MPRLLLSTRRQYRLIALRTEDDFARECGGETENVTAIEWLTKLLADFLKELKSRFVLRRRIEVDIHPIEISFSGNFAESREHSMFHAAAQNATAQEETLDIENGSFWFINDGAGQAVIAEPIAY